VNRIVCIVCEGELPHDREDDLCEACRRRRIVDKRDTRPRILPMPFPVQMSPVPVKEAA